MPITYAKAVRRIIMKKLLAGIVVGLLAASAFDKSKTAAKSMIKKGKRAISRKFDEILDI